MLLLDEPTNDLDIETLTILEDYIDNFQGAVIAVSHDRYFLDRIAEKIFSFKEGGEIVQYSGNYSDYRLKSQEEKVIQLDGEKSKATVDKNKAAVDKIEEKKKPLRFSYMEQREYEQIDGIIGELEEKLNEIEEKINSTTADYTLLQDLLEEKEEVENKLEEKMERWIYLNDIAEKIEKEKK